MIFSQRLKQKIKYNSLFRILHDGLVKAGIKISFFYLVKEGLYREIPELELNKFPDYDLIILDENDITLLSTIPERTLSKEKLLKLLKDECICFGLKKENDLAAVTWVNLKECSYGSFNLPMKEEEACLFGAYTLIKYRGENLAPFIRYQCYKELKKMGKNTLYSISEALNRQSINFKKKLDARFIFLGLHVCLFNKFKFSIPLRKLSS